MKVYRTGSGTAAFRIPKVIAIVRVAGLKFEINDTMEYNKLTEEQIRNLKTTFGIEVTQLEDAE